MSGSIVIVGLGPGSMEWLAPAAKNALGDADLIVGYHNYLKQIANLCPDTPRFGSGMRQEISRAKEALHQANAGKKVAVVSGGDAGIYGMAGLIIELAGEKNTIPIAVLPGISALNAAAALLGAPLMTDFATVSLSNYLVPVETILKRVQAAMDADLVLCIYNPKGMKRTAPFEKVSALLMERPGPDRLIGLVSNAYRDDQQVRIIQVKDLSQAPVDMNSILIVGNSQTKIIRGRLVTPRGYKFTEEFKE